MNKTYYTNDELLPEYLYWVGPGYYASRQNGSHDKQHVNTYWVGDENDTPELIDARCRRNELGSSFWLDNPYGEMQ